jgi:hypothetical protein
VARKAQMSLKNYTDGEMGWTNIAMTESHWLGRAGWKKLPFFEIYTILDAIGGKLSEL